MLMLFLLPEDLKATHQRAGYITYRHISGLTYEVTLITYTYTPSPADRPLLTISWGDGTSDDLQRIEKLDFPNNISKNKYVGTHTYSAPATYTISVEDKNRNGGVLNIPNSVNVAFYIETILVINPFLGPNSSPDILNPPIENACANQPFIYNPSAFDIDGDSLSYRLVNCKGDGGLDVNGYTFPAASSVFSLDAYTGDLFWDSPIQVGEYNVAFLIEEWRHGVLIGSVTVDMQILVAPCDNRPPEIEPLKDYCVLAGTTVNFIVRATDPDMGDVVTLTATGGPFKVTPSAIFPQPSHGTNSVQSYFSWQTHCSHVRKNPYTVTFKAQDNSLPVNLIDIKNVFIRVVAPAPDNLTATALNDAIDLSWDKSICTNAAGYKIYRRQGFYGFVPDSCETGVPSYTGYTLIATLNDVNDTSFVDDNNGAGLPQGHKYCYMVTAWFNDGAESYASDEVCQELPHTAPIITHVSVNHTDPQNGAIYIAWAPPTSLDSAVHTGPFKYYVYRSPGQSLSQAVLIDSLFSISDTSYTDTMLNTVAQTYTYQVELYNNAPSNIFKIGGSEPASSVYLSSYGTNQTVQLSWDYKVPWDNYAYAIFRQNPQTLDFDSIGIAYNNFYYDDTDLVNGKEYCYLVKAKGRYSGSHTHDPLINYSQIICDIPIDTIPPCPPKLTLTTDCDFLSNFLQWHTIADECFEDVTSYRIYYALTGSDDLQLIHVIDNVEDTTFLHQNLPTIAGCYAVTALDSFMNESVFSNIICVDIDSCDLYRLPNVFTPDGDGYNDLFIPFPYDFVEKIDLKIYNRWGGLVFETQDPDINWDGRNMFTNEHSSQGAYFYVCEVYELRLGGIKKRTLSGIVYLLRGSGQKY